MRTKLLHIVVILSLALSVFTASLPARAATPITFTILPTYDFHGNLELSGSDLGAAHVGQIIADVRAAVLGS